MGNWGEFLERVDTWRPQAAGAISAMLDHLHGHRAPDVWLCSLAHPRWECVVQPTDAADLHVIAPWWKALRSLARKGRRGETWAHVGQAIEAATVSWQTHRPPVIWGRRRRHRARRPAGIAVVPKIA
jgi:hypothetical protein